MSQYNDGAWIDEYENRHELPESRKTRDESELARGGQGAVYRTHDEDLAVKQPFGSGGARNMHKLFQHIRTLPLPKGIPVSMPLAILRDEPGYVMKLLNGMKPFSVFSLDGERRKAMKDEDIPAWLAGLADRRMAQDLTYYAQSGSTRRRFYALYKCASILARLHNAGIVYGDVSENNVFIGDDIPCECWLIDADNMRYELPQGGYAVYTPRLGAPEIVQGRDSSRPRTDCWAFAVMAFQMLSLCHPFIGKKVQQPDDDSGWDADPPADGAPADLDEQAYAGYLPFIDDKDDDSNELPNGGLQRKMILTPQLCRLFQETLGAGRIHPHRRPSMAFWALELARAFDSSVICPDCHMSIVYRQDSVICPYCHKPLPGFAVARTDKWKMNLVSSGETSFEVLLPQRLFLPFSFASGDLPEYRAVVNLVDKTVVPVRGTKPFPKDLSFEFINPGNHEMTRKDGVE